MTPQGDLSVHLASLTGLNGPAIRQAWRDRLETDPPPTPSRFLLRAELAWALQAMAYGDLDPTTEKRLTALTRASGRSKKQGYRLSPGDVLVREWRGVEIRVEVLASGFGYDGKIYRSLSAVARAIAGARWSGPRFFGLLEDQKRKTISRR